MEEDLNNDMEEVQENIEEFKDKEDNDDLIGAKKKQGRDRVYSSSGLINP